MSSRFKRILAIWFILQIALPFTAPLQTCDLTDLFGSRQTNHEPDSSTIPLPSDTEAVAKSFVSPIESSALRASTSIAVIPDVAASAPVVGSFDLSPSPQVQQTVLRV